ncbi:inositol-trisphosphate 3-kinase B-like [Sinocyclocheilus rhinocerous]|uniref:inositol-trisphosphate 3-kinase B-like n=1 Tax=Sinocyclocheilus rhinocerous TaxID=307959 RepID=UPI0007BADB87|nr:PREDICTED: inositol-trisphosphate 3-kinase B-like [Sinocyclocheilus rhinocerous]
MKDWQLRFSSSRVQNNKTGVSSISDENFPPSGFMKDLDSPPEKMSILSEKKSNGSDGESMRDAIEERIFDFSPSSINQSNHIKKTGFRARPKLASAHAVLSSKLEDPTEMQTNACEEPEVMKPEPLERVCMDPLPIPAGETTKDEDVEEQKVKERVMAGENLVEEGSNVELNAATRKSLWRSKIEPRERLKEGMRERLGASVESIDESNKGDFSNKRLHRKKSWGSRQRNTQTLVSSQDGEHYMEGSVEKDGEEELVPHPVLSRVLFHSSTSSSSSFNNSSAESDEVFSENEDTDTRRQTMKKCRSWRTFLTMMQWSKRTQSSWIQLAGHQGNVRLSEGGEVLKRFCEVEAVCLQVLMSDALCQFVPHYFGHISQDGERYIRLEDLLSGLKNPVIMDCKMSVRTYQEEEISKARSNAIVRSDMYQKMVKVDPAAPTAEEHAQRGVTKLRYLQWRDDSSSTSSLGFRIEGIVMRNGKVLRDFYKTRTEAQVTETLLTFTRRQVHILEAYESRLQALNKALKESNFFNSHEIIGSSLLFVHDCSGKANIWMIDFGKTIPTPEDVQLRHDVPWVEGNREDGYLIGLTSLVTLLGEAIKQAGEQS